MSKALPINISILDKEYKIACPAGEQTALLASAEYLDTKMREVRASGSIIGSERIAVITALNITHELLNSTQQKDSLHGALPPRLKNLELKISAALQKARQIEI
ncbi:MAG: cell division protein ZapA [Gammaproteobacteria bacterium]|nr:cell division protein ZapA [Gammaproteobacteria bacterium]MBL6999470.1 cell division protein ZapA [Gammaproteobacteria bacterium]